MEIKVRFWDEVNNKFWNGGEEGEGIGHECFQSFFENGLLVGRIGETIDVGVGFDFKERELPSSQYTGLKDKNGVEIYEGDIVKRIENTGYTFVGEVIYEEYGFGIKPYGFFRPLSKRGKYEDGKSSFDFSVEYEIIGNIYEHPELLGDAK